MSDVKFSKKQKAYIIDCIKDSLKVAKELALRYNESVRGSEYRCYLFGSLQYYLSEITGVDADELFSVEGK